MKNSIRIILLSVFFLISCGGKIRDNISKPPFNEFQVIIEQNNTIKDINENSEVFIDKAPFWIIIKFSSPDGIFVNASEKSLSYDEAAIGADINRIPGFEGAGIAEELFNRDESLVLSDNAPNYWHYAGSDEHRFSDVRFESGVYTCRRKISHLVDIDDGRETVDIGAYQGDMVYLVFMKIQWSQDFSRKIEKKREFFKLIFQ